MTVDSSDFATSSRWWTPQSELGQADVNDTPGVVVAGAGYWPQEQMTTIAGRGPMRSSHPTESARLLRLFGFPGRLRGRLGGHDASALRQAASDQGDRPVPLTGATARLGSDSVAEERTDSPPKERT